MYFNRDFFFNLNKYNFYIPVPPQPPSISINQSSPYVENSVISLNCSSQGGKPTPTIQWWRNGQLVGGAIVTPPAQEMGTTSSLLTVTLTRSDHSANYSCSVFNAANQNQPRISSRILQVQCKYFHIFFKTEIEINSDQLMKKILLFQ